MPHRLVIAVVRMALSSRKARVRLSAHTAQRSNLIVLDTAVVDPRISAWAKGYGVGQMEFGMTEELPGASKNHKGRDLSTHGRVSRMMQIKLFAKDVPMLTTKMGMLKEDNVPLHRLALSEAQIALLLGNSVTKQA